MHLQNKAQVSCIESCQLLSNAFQHVPHVQISSANMHHAKAALADHRGKLKTYHTEMQVLKRLRYACCSTIPHASTLLQIIVIATVKHLQTACLQMFQMSKGAKQCMCLVSLLDTQEAVLVCRTTEQAAQCWTPAAVSKGFDTFLAQAPVEVAAISTYAFKSLVSCCTCSPKQTT